MVLIVWIVVAVLAVVVLGALAFGVLGAFGRLNRELRALERDVQPLLDQGQATAQKAAAQRAERAATAD